MPDSSMPQPMPGQGACPPGFRPSAPYPGMPQNGTSCAPIGPGVPSGGWKESAPGFGEGYAPKGAAAIDALQSLPWAAAEQLAGSPGEASQAVSGYLGSYADWLRGMAR